MAVRSVRAFLHNDTDHPLVKLSDECPHGEWTARAPDRIEAHSTAMMRAAAKLVGSVESRATYQIGDDTSATVYIHWDNTAKSNSYHTNTGPGNYAFWSAPTSGSDPVAHFVLRPAGRVETDFLPSRDAFHFDNSWPNTPYSLPPLRGTLLDKKYGNADNGLCGGMVLGALDYFVAGQEIPSTKVAPMGERDPLFIHLVNRIFDTFSVDSVSLMLKLMNPLYPDGDENVLSTFGLADGRAAVMAHQEWPLIRADIDAGRPSPVCIVTVKSANPGDLGKNHQLLAYAYEASGHDVKVLLYDPNNPEHPDDTYMKFNDGDVSRRIVVEHNIKVSGRPVYCFIRMNGAPKPIPFPTRPRLTAIERQARRINIVREKQVVLSNKLVGKGRRTFDVWPNCGEHEFPFTVHQRTVSSTITVTTPYYREPVLSWRINGTPVPRGEDLIFVRAEADRPVDAPDRPPQPDEASGIKVTPPGMVALRTKLLDHQLQIVNDSEDGNYTLVVQVSARDGSDMSSVTSRTTAVDVEGFHEVVEGLEEASAECWKKYLNQYRREQTPVGAVAAALYAQLRRPGDPLWDPDPDMTGIGIKVALDDPTVIAVDKWQKDLTAPTGMDTVSVDPASVGTTHGAVHVNPADITAGIGDLLRSIPTKFNPG